MIARAPAADLRSPLGERLRSAKNAGIVKVLAPDGESHVGMGILIAPDLVVTCAHVVNAALDRDLLATEKPGAEDRVSVTFPIVSEGKPIGAFVKRWRAAGASPKDDIALLWLEQPAPAAAGVAVLADITAMSMSADRLSVFGLAGGDDLGTNVDARFMGSATAAWIQIDAIDQSGAFVEPGYSGAAVWDANHDVFVGMVVSKRRSQTARIAYMIPAADIAEVVPELRIERRSLSARFSPLWTIMAGLTFLLLLSHWAVDRGIQSFGVLSIGGAHRQLSAFWGMMIATFLVPTVLALLVVFAKAFGQQPWWRRVPSFGYLGAPPRGSGRRLTALLSIAGFVLLPIAAQAHFILRFHKEGSIYIYPEKFGYEARELSGCRPVSEPLCLHPVPVRARYALVTPIRKADGGYWDNAYHYGTNERSVTYFPILQPVLSLISLTFSTVLALVAFVRIFGGSLREPWRRSVGDRLADESM
jgi:hypothetical protein